MKRFYLFLILGSILMSSKTWGNTEYSCLLQFDREELSIRDTLDANSRTSIVTLSDLPLTDVENMPSLPYRQLLISVPFNSKNFTLEVEDIKTTSFPIKYPVILNCARENSSLTDSNLSNRIDVSVMQGMERVRIVDNSIIRGFNRVLSIIVYPVVYSEKDMTLNLMEECRLKLGWTIDDRLWDEAIIPCHERTVNSVLDDVKSLVINPEYVDNDNISLNRKQRSVPSVNADFFQYIIITPQRLSDSFERLVALRKLRGISTHIFCIEDILSDDRFKDGDSVSGINDNAGKLRSFLRYAYQNYGTEYVLLAGSYPDMPVRMVRYTKSEKVNGVYQTDTIRYTSDHYFAELNASWSNRDATGATVQTKAIANNSYELKIGRLTASTKKDIDSYVDKVFYYELNPGKGNIEYLGNGFVSISKEMNEAYKTYNQSRYNNVYPNLKELFQTASDYPTGNDVLENLNMGQWGYVDFQGHGNPQGVQTTDDFNDGKAFRWYGINALNNERRSLVDEDCNGLDNWNNRYYPNWTTSMSCTLSPFVHDRDFTYTFAESYLLGEGYGGVAFLGNTDAGYIYTSNRLQESIFSFLEKHSGSIVSPPYSANIEVGGKELYQFGSYYEIILRHCLSGDPMVNIWYGKPKMIESSGSSLIISGIDSTEALVSATRLVQDNLCNQSTLYIEDVRSTPTFNAFQTIYRGDVIPFFRPVYISGISFDYNDYFIGGEVSFAKRGSMTDIIFRTTNKVVFEALKNVRVSSNVIVENNSECSIISHTDAEIEDCKIKGEGTMNISANKITINKNTEISKGVKLIIESNQ